MRLGHSDARQRNLKPSDFSEEYTGKRVVLRMSDGSTVEGQLLEARKYWFKVKSNTGVIYVNKGFVKSIEVFEEKKK